MLKHGIFTAEEYLQLEKDRRRYCGARVAYNLLLVGDNPTEAQIRMFEDISFTLFTSNGTTRTTFRHRFEDVDRLAMHWIGKLFPRDAELRIQDRAVSHGLTSLEFARHILQAYPKSDYEASDLLLSLVELRLANGETYITEPSGSPLQYLKPPFAVSLSYPEALRYPINRWVARRALKRFQKLPLPDAWTTSKGGPAFQVRQIPYIHPEAAEFSRHNPGFHFETRSVFAPTPGACQILRTMNIFNRAYFSQQQLEEGGAAAFKSLVPGGLWIVGRTLEQDFTNHVTFLRRGEHGWEVLERIGSGSEMESVVLPPNALPNA
jgi:hypothetical protein